MWSSPQNQGTQRSRKIRAGRRQLALTIRMSLVGLVRAALGEWGVSWECMWRENEDCTFQILPIKRGRWSRN